MSAIAQDPINLPGIKKFASRYSLSRAWRLGRAVLEAKLKNTSPLDAISSTENGELVFVEKIVDVTASSEGS